LTASQVRLRPHVLLVFCLLDDCLPSLPLVACWYPEGKCCSALCTVLLCVPTHAGGKRKAREVETGFRDTALHGSSMPAAAVTPPPADGGAGEGADGAQA
jgi:hypothetical protein